MSLLAGAAFAEMSLTDLVDTDVIYLFRILRSVFALSGQEPET